MDLHQCYRAIIDASRSRTGQRGQLIDYAASYAEHGLRLRNANSSADLTDETRTQALYTRSNLGSWRGEKATEVRKNMDRILKGK